MRKRFLCSWIYCFLWHPQNSEALMSNSAPAYINDNSGYEINLVRKRKSDGEATPTKRVRL